MSNRFNHTKYGKMRRWLRYMGLGWHDARDVFQPNPYERVRRRLPLVFGLAPGERPPRRPIRLDAASFMKGLAEACPELDGGWIHASATRRVPREERTCTRALSHALVDLHLDGVIRLDCPADSLGWSLAQAEPPRDATHLRSERFDAVEWPGPAPRRTAMQPDPRLAYPARRPSRLGEPCWTPEGAAAAISGVAQVDRNRTHFFLASHAPVRHLEDASTGRAVTEEEAFRRMAASAKAETLVLVKGGPGTGKSHLINWLKLRFESGAAAGEHRLGDVVPVLVQRRTGSLRDALEQIVAQLPTAFHGYLDPIRSAIDRITQAEARQKLAAAMHLELGVRWSEERRAKELHRDLRHLAEAFRSDGFTTWLCREGGAIDLSIKRLVDPSETHDREDVPVFEPADFLVTNPMLAARDRNTLNVYNLIAALLDEPDFAVRAAEVCTGVLRSALGEVTGLGGTRLAEVFARIRADLRAQGRRLAVFIEDVSTLSVLDAEVVNALEPQNNSMLCPLMSVVGLTESAFARLPENQVQRASLVLSLGNAHTTTWRDDADEVDRFVARYLNAARLAEPAVEAVAAGRRRPGADVKLSACERCPVREECHGTFGAVSLGEGDEDGPGPVPVGLFPFSSAAPYRLLSNLDDRGRVRVERTPRGLLDFVVYPVLAMAEAADARTAAYPGVPLRIQEPAYWTGFRETYAGGWRHEDLARLKFLAEAWVDADDAAAAAASLQPFLAPLGLPPFTSRVATPRHKPAAQPPERGPTPEPPTGRPVVVLDPRIPPLSKKLSEWVVGRETLQAPRDVQSLLLDLVRKALPFEDRRELPDAARAAVIKERIGIIRLEDAATRSATETFFLDFPRTEETRELVLALAYHAYQGKGSWDFKPDAERHKRTVARWLRRNQDRLMAAVDPTGLDIAAPVSAALDFLAVSSLIERGSELPSDTPAAVETLLRAGGEGPPRAALSEDLGRLYRDLPHRRGGCASSCWRNSTCRKAAVAATSSTLSRSWSDSRACAPGRRSWRCRPRTTTVTGSRANLGLAELDAWAGLAGAVASERSAIEDCLGDIGRGLAREGYLTEVSPEGEGERLGDVYAQFMRDLGTLTQTQKETRHEMPHPEFARLFREDPGSGAAPARKATLAAAVRAAETTVADGGDRAVLAFDPAPLAEARRALQVALDYVAAVRRDVGAKLERIGVEGDYDAVVERLKVGLDALLAATSPPSDHAGVEAPDDESGEDEDDGDEGDVEAA